MPQDSVFGAVLFLFYTAEVTAISNLNTLVACIHMLTTHSFTTTERLNMLNHRYLY